MHLIFLHVLVLSGRPEDLWHCLHFELSPGSAAATPGAARWEHPSREARSAAAPLHQRPHPAPALRGSGSDSPWTQSFGATCSPPWLLSTFFILRSLGSTWCFSSLGDNILPPNEAPDLSWIPQIKLARPWLHPVWISHLPNDFMSRTQRVNFLLTFPIAAVSILL